MDTQRWFSLLMKRWEGAVVFVKEHARPFFTDQAQQLQQATGRESYILGIDHAVRTFPMLLEHYPDALTAQARIQILLTLVGASHNEYLPLKHKHNILATLEHSWPLLTAAQRQRLRRAFLKQSDSDRLTLATLRESPGPGYAPDTRPLQFHRLQLYVLLDSPVLVQDWQLLLDTLTDDEQFHRQEALETLNFLLSEGRFPRADLYALLLPSTGGQTLSAGYALYLCIRFPPAPEDSWHAAVLHRVRRCIQKDDVQAIHAMLSAVEQLPSDHDFKGRCLIELVGLKTHANRRVRTRVTHLLDGNEGRLS